MIDMHSHILHNIDDGSTCVEMSIEMISALKEQGIDNVLLTPHFYAYTTDIETFLNRRKRSVDSLIKAINENGIDIGLYVGAEVLYFDDISSIDDIGELAIEGTKYIMIEMPFSAWNDSMIDKISRLISKGYIPIMAHIDRYIRYQKGYTYFYRLAEMGALLQINTASMLSFWQRIKLKPLIKKGLISFIGTDSHNMTSRAPNFGVAKPYIEKLFTKEQRQYLFNRERIFLKDAKKIY